MILNRAIFVKKAIAIGALFACMICFLNAHPANAQTQSNDGVIVRTGTHADYSRLVFDWPKKTAFELSKKDENTLVATFKNGATPQTEKLDTAQTDNIKNVAFISNQPLKISMTIPQSSRYRGFYVGNKVVIDVYNPANADDKIANTSAAPAQISQSIKASASTASPSSTKPEAAKILPAKEPPLKQYANKPSAQPDLISISSSKSVGLAVFERGNKLWIVNDKADILLNPQVTGPNTDSYLPFETIALSNAKAFTTTMRANAFARTQGGGLLWKIIIADQPQSQKPIEPIREGVRDGEARGGKLIWPFEEPGKVVNITDPVTGRDLIIVTAKSAKEFSGPARSFVDFDMLPSSAGLVIAPKTNGIKASITERGVEISHPRGLAILPQSKIDAKTKKQEKRPTLSTAVANRPRIFNFESWQLGGLEAAHENQAIILADLHSLPKSASDESLMTLAKMYLSVGMGAESLGFLYMIEESNPDIAKTAEFRAIRGAAKALDYKFEEAFTDLSVPDLAAFDEIGMWKAIALADLGDWQQAIDSLPKDVSALLKYPDPIKNRVGLIVAEVSLRAGNVGMADEVLAMIEENVESLRAPELAAFQYLKGEAARQDGDIESTKLYWEPLVEGADDLYRAKAGLALTRLLVNKGELEPEKAVDNLERLRYAWRGDELEGQINYWLGKTYFEGRDFVKGLNIMREAASFTANTKLGDRITNEMRDVFVELYLGGELESVSALDAVALYEQFSELIPIGEQGDQIVERLADRLAQADLLGRAAELLEYQVNHRLKGAQAYNASTKLAAIRLLDSQPAKAITALDTAQKALDAMPQPQRASNMQQDVSMLRARALSRQGRPDQAIELLNDINPDPSINRLSADIAWTAGYWDDAAQALENVILDENISLTRPLNTENNTLILQRAIALNLASDRIALANMREKYADAMAQTDKARIFDVITRPRQNAALADRDTLLNIVSEVDLFEDFLNNYKAISSPSN